MPLRPDASTQDREAGQLWLPASFFGVEHVRVAIRYAAGDLSLLTDDERRRYDSFASQKRRAEFLRGRCVLRLAVRAVRRAPTDPVRLRHLEGGGLILEEGDLRVSLTHTGEMAAVALSPAATPVGLDAEKIRPVVPGLASRMLARGEALPDCEEPELVVWTAKEAVLKALGRGLRTRMEALTLRWVDGGSRAVATSPASETSFKVHVRNDTEYLWALALPETAS